MLLFQGSIRSNIQSTKGVNIHNDIQKIIFKEILQRSVIFFCHFIILKIKINLAKFIIDSSTINYLNRVHHAYIIQEREVIFGKKNLTLVLGARLLSPCLMLFNSGIISFQVMIVI